MAKIALFGASGMIGQRILAEALQRGHQVTAIVRNPDRIQTTHPNLKAVKGDALNVDSVAKLAAGHDVVVSSINYAYDGSSTPQVFTDAAHSLIEGVKRAGVKRLIVVGGAGSLEVAPGLQLVDTPEFPAAWKMGAMALRDALGIYRSSDIDWTFFSPAGVIQPGERTGRFRLGGDQLLTDAQGQSQISCEDYAVALLDEIEKPQFIRQRFTIAY